MNGWSFAHTAKEASEMGFKDPCRQHALVSWTGVIFASLFSKAKSVTSGVPGGLQKLLSKLSLNSLTAGKRKKKPFTEKKQRNCPAGIDHFLLDFLDELHAIWFPDFLPQLFHLAGVTVTWKLCHFIDINVTLGMSPSVFFRLSTTASK